MGVTFSLGVVVLAIGGIALGGNCPTEVRVLRGELSWWAAVIGLGTRNA